MPLTTASVTPTVAAATVTPTLAADTLPGVSSDATSFSVSVFSFARVRNGRKRSLQTRAQAAIVGRMLTTAALVLATMIPLMTTALTNVMLAFRAANGGNAWCAVDSLAVRGNKTSWGLRGHYAEVDDLQTGFYKSEAQYSVFANADGLNASGRWRKDQSGAVHFLNANPAKAVAITEAYIARRAYFTRSCPKRNVSATFQTQDDGTFYRVNMTPAGGRVATLWIRKQTLLLERITMRRPEFDEQIRFADYRLVNGVRLPFKIMIDNGDEADSGTLSIIAYRRRERVNQHAFDTPVQPADVTLPNHVDHVVVPAQIDSRSGFFIVHAKINGQGPFPFVLDTGGHNILTPGAARVLGLRIVGSGESLGAGSGTTQTRFSKVTSIQIGSARIAEQPMTILYLDLGSVNGARNRSIPIAGILGLELFERFTVRIDYSRGQLILARARLTAQKITQTIPIRFTSDMPLIRAALHGATGTFGVDTANNAGLIVTSHWLHENGLQRSLRLGTAMSGDSVGGAVHLRRAIAGGFTLGRTVLTRFPILVSAESSGSLSADDEAGNIGESVLSQFAQVTFDYGRGVLLLEAR